jgi:hypothetical protein
MLRLLSSAFAVALAVALLAATPHPASAGCTMERASARGPATAAVSDRAERRLQTKITRLSRHNEGAAVRMGMRTTTCSEKGPMTWCTSEAKVCL